MPRATSKPDLLSAIAQERQALENVLRTLTPQQMVAPGVVDVWSVKDVLAHLVAWEQLVLGWYRAGLQGELPAMPAPGYKWNQIPELNQMIYETHREQPLDEVVAQFHHSHQEILQVIEGLSNEDLFRAGQYAWTQKNTMGTYFVSATSSHYLWARKEIRKWLKRQSAV